VPSMHQAMAPASRGADPQINTRCVRSWPNTPQRSDNFHGDVRNRKDMIVNTATGHSDEDHLANSAL
jgi:hypothetical protein